jgi:hypothetical protein
MRLQRGALGVEKLAIEQPGNNLLCFVASHFLP